MAKMCEFKVFLAKPEATKKLTDKNAPLVIADNNEFDMGPYTGGDEHSITFNF